VPQLDLYAAVAAAGGVGAEAAATRGRVPGGLGGADPAALLTPAFAAAGERIAARVASA
jgi:hypothetical protein